MRRAGHLVLRLVALFYAYGGLVHVLNMLGLTGIDWPAAPLKWQLLDVVYLALDAVVCVGFFFRSRIAIAAFYLAATSQTVLYTVFRDWIIDVPEPFTVSPEQVEYLTLLVVFHLVTLVLVTLAIRWTTPAVE